MPLLIGNYHYKTNLNCEKKRIGNFKTKADEIIIIYYSTYVY